MNNAAVTNQSRRAFLLRSEIEKPRVALNDHCLAFRAIHCELCRDVCEAGALRFVPRLSAMSIPAFNLDLCTQCGDCARVCPQNAIDVRLLVAING